MADADLVLEGGGVKGTGLVGAITALASAAEPYTIHHVSGERGHWNHLAVIISNPDCAAPE